MRHGSYDAKTCRAHAHAAAHMLGPCRPLPPPSWVTMSAYKQYLQMHAQCSCILRALALSREAVESISVHSVRPPSSDTLQGSWGADGARQDNDLNCQEKPSPV